MPMLSSVGDGAALRVDALSLLDPFFPCGPEGRLFGELRVGCLPIPATADRSEPVIILEGHVAFADHDADDVSAKADDPVWNANAGQFSSPLTVIRIIDSDVGT
jgi:hypothetical protein